jgi:hypothetical protein
VLHAVKMDLFSQEEMDNCIILIFYKKAKLLQAQRVY